MRTILNESAERGLIMTSMVRTRKAQVAIIAAALLLAAGIALSLGAQTQSAYAADQSLAPVKKLQIHGPGEVTPIMVGESETVSFDNGVKGQTGTWTVTGDALDNKLVKVEGKPALGQAGQSGDKLELTITGLQAGAGTLAVEFVTSEGKSGSFDVTVSVTKKTQTISAKNVSVAMGKTKAIGATAATALTYQSLNTKVAKVAKNGKITPVKVGTAKIKITAKETNMYKKATKTITVTVKQGKQTVAFNGQSKNVNYNKLQKKDQVVKIKQATAKTKVTYQIMKVSKGKMDSFSIGKTTGKITVKKGLKKGVYKVKVRASAKKTTNWAAAQKTRIIKITVK